MPASSWFQPLFFQDSLAANRTKSTPTLSKIWLHLKVERLIQFGDGRKRNAYAREARKEDEEARKNRPPKRPVGETETTKSRKMVRKTRGRAGPVARAERLPVGSRADASIAAAVSDRGGVRSAGGPRQRE